MTCKHGVCSDLPVPWLGSFSPSVSAPLVLGSTLSCTLGLLAQKHNSSTPASDQFAQVVNQFLSVFCRKSGPYLASLVTHQKPEVSRAAGSQPSGRSLRNVPPDPRHTAGPPALPTESGTETSAGLKPALKHFGLVMTCQRAQHLSKNLTLY